MDRLDFLLVIGNFFSRRIIVVRGVLDGKVLMRQLMWVTVHGSQRMYTIQDNRYRKKVSFAGQCVPLQKGNIVFREGIPVLQW